MKIEDSRVDYNVREAYAERRQMRDQVRVTVADAPAPQDVGQQDMPGDARWWLARMVVEVLLGGHFSPQAAAPAQQAPPRWSVTVTHQEVYDESQSLVVKARGAVRTEDGREIQFDAEFSLARNFHLESGSAVAAGNGQASDPLFLETGKGLALLERDGGGVFGARTGDGFGELAAVDSDNNGWIDSGDPVFGQLHLRLADGTLGDLESLGIGAISTTGAAGEFQYKNEANELRAVVRRTGVYLTEDGRPGAVRQIDVVA